MVNGNISNTWYDWPSNYSNGTSSVNGIGSFVQYSSLLVNNWLGYGIIIMLWVVIFGMSLVVGSRRALLTSSFICFILSIYLVRIGILNPIVSIILIVLTIVGAIGSKEDRSL